MDETLERLGSDQTQLSELLTSTRSEMGANFSVEMVAAPQTQSE
jgi:hypothetical protein